MKIVKEFREFIARGDVLELAVGVIIGGAFGKIVTSLVDDIIMPPIGWLIGGVNFTELRIVLRDQFVDAAGKTIPAVSVNYGNFIQMTLNFLIVAIAIFLMVKTVNKLKHQQKQADAKKSTEKEETKLLREIRDLLKKR